MALAQVVLIEDDQFSRTTLANALLLADFSVVAAVSKASEALTAIEKTAIDVAIIDIDLGPGPTGIDVAWALREAHPFLGIVFLTSFQDPRLSASGSRPLPQGARYLAKGDLKSLEALIAIVLQAKYKPLVTNGSIRKSSDLTTNQLAILRMVALGETNASIASQLEVSEKAIEHTLTRIAKALNLKRSPQTNARIQLTRAYAELTGKPLPN